MFIQKFTLRSLFLGLLAACLLFLVVFRFQHHEWAQPDRRNAIQSSRTSGVPGTVLWAWERPEKLDFIDPERVGVAFLAKTIYLRGNRVVRRPRLQPLLLPPATRVIAVARIESEDQTNQSMHSAPSPAQVSETAAAISELGTLPNVVMVQVDFDATASERAFYRDLLIQLRQKLPESISLSMTALASWCKSDNWLEDLPVDEAVPMLFRMGVERNQFLSQLAAGDKFQSRPCLGSAGVSADEPLTQLPRVQRLYVFNPQVWSRESFNQVLETYNR